MLKALLFLAAVLISSLATAQISITASDMPDPNDSVLVSHVGGVSTDHTLTGAGYTWDYSTLIPVIQRWEKFDSPLTFPSPYNLLFSPLNCSYGKDRYELTTLPIPGVSLDAAYDFLRESSSSYQQIGAGYVLDGNPLPFLYTAADYIYRFPMNYGDIDTCDFKYGLPVPGMGYYGQTGHRHTIVDGYGTLITPYGTYDVLRMVSTVTAVDSLYIDAFGFGTNIPRPTMYQYKWMANGMKVPVMQIDANDVGGTPVISNVQYIDTVQPGVPQVGISEQLQASASVYPNPFSDHAIFHFAGAEADQLIIMDVSGKMIRREKLNGVVEYIFRRQGLSSGLYFYHITSSERQILSSGKLLIR